MPALVLGFVIGYDWRSTKRFAVMTLLLALLALGPAQAGTCSAVVGLADGQVQLRLEGLDIRVAVFVKSGQKTIGRGYSGGEGRTTLMVDRREGDSTWSVRAGDSRCDVSVTNLLPAAPEPRVFKRPGERDPAQAADASACEQALAEERVAWVAVAQTQDARLADRAEVAAQEAKALRSALEGLDGAALAAIGDTARYARNAAKLAEWMAGLAAANQACLSAEATGATERCEQTREELLRRSANVVDLSRPRDVPKRPESS